METHGNSHARNTPRDDRRGTFGNESGSDRCRDLIRSSLEPELRDAGLKNPAAFTVFLRVMARHTTEVFVSQTMLAETGLDSDELGDRLNLAGALGILYLLPSFFGAVGKTLEHRPR